MARSGIRAELLRHGSAAVPLKQVFQCIGLACQSRETEHLGLHVRSAMSSEDLGPYGRALAGVLTLYGSIHWGIALYGTVAIRQPNWLPAPDGPFYMVMRLCRTERAALEGRWTPHPRSERSKQQDFGRSPCGPSNEIAGGIWVFLAPRPAGTISSASASRGRRSSTAAGLSLAFNR